MKILSVPLLGTVLPNDQIGLSPLGARDDHPDPRTLAVDVALVVERDRHYVNVPVGSGLHVRAAERRRGRRGSTAGGELAPACAQPPALHERLLAVRADLGDRRLKVDVRRGRLDPHLDGAAADDRRVRGQRRGHVRDRRPGRVLGPVVGRRRGPQAARAAAGVAGEVGRRASLLVPGEVVAGRGRRSACRRSACRRRRSTTSGPGCRGSGTWRTSARSRAPGCRASPTRRRCRTGRGRAAAADRRRARRSSSARTGSGRSAASRRSRRAPSCTASARLALTPAESVGVCRATYSLRKSYQRLNVAGSSESVWTPFVNVNHLWVVPVKCDTRSGQCPPVCSSVNWQAMYTGTLILLTNLIGLVGSAIAGT